MNISSAPKHSCRDTVSNPEPNDGINETPEYLAHKAIVEERVMRTKRAAALRLEGKRKKLAKAYMIHFNFCDFRQNMKNTFDKSFNLHVSLSCSHATQVLHKRVRQR